MIENLGKTKTKWPFRFFQLYSDRKRIRELDVTEVRKMTSNSIIISVGKNELNISKGAHYVNFPTRQLREVLDSVDCVQKDAKQ